MKRYGGQWQDVSTQDTPDFYAVRIAFHGGAVFEAVRSVDLIGAVFTRDAFQHLIAIQP